MAAASHEVFRTRQGQLQRILVLQSRRRGDLLPRASRPARPNPRETLSEEVVNRRRSSERSMWLELLSWAGSLGRFWFVCLRPFGERVALTEKPVLRNGLLTAGTRRSCQEPSLRS